MKLFFVANLLHALQFCTLKSLLIHNFSWIIFKYGKDIYCSRVSEEFDYGGSGPLNMRIMDHLLNRSISAIRDSFFFRYKAIKTGTNVQLNVLIDISCGFHHNLENVLANLLCVFQLCILKITDNAVTSVIIRSFENVVRTWRFIE